MDSCTIKTFDSLASKFRDQIREIESRRPAQVQFVVKQKPVRVDKTRGVFGIHKLAPVDKAASMMLAKSRWNNPPEIETNMDHQKLHKTEKKTKKRKEKNVQKKQCDIPAETEKSKSDTAFLSASDLIRFFNFS